MTHFRLAQIKIDQFAILEDKIPQGDINLNMELMPGGMIRKHIVAMQIKVTFTASEERVLLTLVATCFFEIEPNSWQEWMRENQVVIPRDFLVHAAIHTVGTARGILFAKTEGTMFQSFILPPTNVDAMIKEDCILE